MRIIDETGDTAVTWAEEDTESLARAESLFDLMTAKRHIPFARPKGGTAEEAERISSFRPEAEEILWVRPIAGG